jgi:ribosome-associated protein
LARLVRKKWVEAPPEFLIRTRRIGESAAERKAIDIRAYDVRGLTVIADAFVLCSAASEPQLRAIFNGVREGMKETGAAPLRSEGEFKGGWLVIDYGDVIVHIFRQEAREFYDLDGLWADAPQVELNLAP